MPNDTPAPQSVTGTQLLTLDPQTYVAAVFAPFRDRLDAAKQAASAVAVIDCRSTEGMKVAIGHRAALRTIRVEAEKARQMRKKPILDIGRLLDSRAKELEDEIAPLEDRFDAAIKAEEQRKEKEKADRENAERERVARIQARIKEIKDTIIDAVGRPAVKIAELRTGLAETSVDPETFFEFRDDAAVALRETITKLDEMHAAALAQETEAARIRAEREEFERQQAEVARLAGLRADIEAIKAEPVRMIGRSSQLINERLSALQQQDFAPFSELADEARAAHAVAVQQLQAMLTDAQARERMKADEERIAAEARALEDRQRQEREAQEARERQERMAQEERERQDRLAAERRDREEREQREAAEKAERERIEAAQRQQEQEEREAREAEEARQREEQRQANELLDGRQMLETFQTRFGHRVEFAPVVKAIGRFLMPPSAKRKTAEPAHV